jgi:hypothetical protein
MCALRSSARNTPAENSENSGWGVIAALSRRHAQACNSQVTARPIQAVAVRDVNFVSQPNVQ